MMKGSKGTLFGAVGAIVAVAALGAGCGKSGEPAANGSGATYAATTYNGAVACDGSSTVTPIMEAIAEEFSLRNPDAHVTVGTSGTGGGFKKFIQGETDISMASRPIKKEEADQLKEKGIEYMEVPIAFDGLTVVVNNENTWVDHLTVVELNKVWAPGSKVNNWSQVRIGFPNEPIKLYGAGTDSGTFDYFTLAINGKEGASRADYQASEDDNVLVQGVVGDKGALGYFGYAYYAAQPDKMKAVKIVAPNGTAISPSETTISDGSYQPLSRPLFVYVKKSAADENTTLDAVIQSLLSPEGAKLISSTGYVPLPQNILDLVLKHYSDRVTGTRFSGAEVGVSIDKILATESK